MGTGDWTRLPRRVGWPEPADAGRLVHRGAHGGRCFLEQSKTGAGLFCFPAVPGDRAVRHLHGVELSSLVPLLGVEPDPGVFPDPDVGRPGTGGAATQFFVYTMVGSITLLLAFLAIFLASGSFDFIELARMAQTGQLAAAMAQNLHWHQWDSGHITMLFFAVLF